MKNPALLKDLAHCGSPETLLAAILKHHPDMLAPIDIEAIARSCGIVEFGSLETSVSGSALQADMGRAQGNILCGTGMSVQRCRFAIAHQLGHFLIKTHQGDRQCAGRDLAENRRDTPRRKEEMQANRFAAGVLMPKPLFLALVVSLGKPMVTHLPAIAAAFEVTLEAAASRHADLVPAMCALVFIKDGIVRYSRPSRSFPPLGVSSGDPSPPAVDADCPGDGGPWRAADVRDWLALARDARPPTLTMQVLAKANGFRLVMLSVNAAAERRADEEAEKFANERPKFGR